MKLISRIMFLMVMLLGCFLKAQPKLPPEGRFYRAEYVSQFIKPGDIGVEIGVQTGSFSYHVLLQKNPSKLYLIDPWIYGIQKDVDKEEWTPEIQNMRDRQYEYVCKLFHPYENVEIIRLRSEEAFEMFEDEYFDYVYIDGEHSYEAVTRDLNNYFPKVKIGGYLIGDDYGWTGIAPAVQDFLKTHKKDCKFVDAKVGQYVLQRVK
jgi:precorrin-6B methylase 2